MISFKRISSLLLIAVPSLCFSQGYIDHIKNQEYLKLRNSINCDTPSDNLSERICANLAFQKSDSLLAVLYESLLLDVADTGSSKMKIINMQVTWRRLRDQRCEIVYDQYEGCGSCHARAIAYLNCLKEMTDNRIKEITKLKRALR